MLLVRIVFWLCIAAIILWLVGWVSWLFWFVTAPIIILGSIQAHRVKKERQQ